MKCNISQIWHVGWSPILVVSLVNHLPHTTLLSTSACFESLKAANEHFQFRLKILGVPKIPKTQGSRFPFFQKLPFSLRDVPAYNFFLWPPCHPRWDLSEDGSGTLAFLHMWHVSHQKFSLSWSVIKYLSGWWFQTLFFFFHPYLGFKYFLKVCSVFMDCSPTCQEQNQLGQYSQYTHIRIYIYIDINFVSNIIPLSLLGRYPPFIKKNTVTPQLRNGIRLLG